MHAIYINGSTTPTVIQPETSTWRPRKATYPWIVTVNGAPDQVVEQYTPPRPPVRPKPITPFGGSWAHDMQRLREGHSDAVAKFRAMRDAGGNIA